MATLTKGETFTIEVTASPAESVSAVFGGVETHTEAATQEGNVWKVAADTSAWEPGNYAYEVWVTFEDGSKQIAAQGALTLKVSAINLAAGTDARSKVQIIVDNLEAMLAGNASEMVRKYKINNRELDRYSIPEILSLLNYWRGRLQFENRKAAGITGLGRRIETFI